MKRKKIFRTTAFWLLVLSMLAFSTASFLPPSAAGKSEAADGLLTADWQAKVQSTVLEKAALGQTEFLIYMEQKADLSRAESLATKEEKGQYVYDQLTQTAETSQSGLKQLLDSYGVEYRAFWISNAVWAKGDISVVQAVASRPEVAYI